MSDRKILEATSSIIEHSYVETKIKEYGLCGRCDSLKYRKTKLHDSEVWCDAFGHKKYQNKLLPNKTDPIADCSQFYPKGQLSLPNMIKIATLIDIEEKITGFRTNNEKEIIITKPSENDLEGVF